MKMYRLTAVASCVATLSLVGCTGVPEQQVEEAYHALMVADSLEADVYVPELYVAAQDSFVAAQAEIEGQEDVAGERADYSHARTLLAYALSTANQAAAEVPNRKEQMRVENDSLLAEAQRRFTETEATLEGKASTSPSVSAVTLAQESASVDQLLEQAVEAQEQGGFKRANDLVRQALEQLTSLELQVAAPQASPSPRS